MTALLLGMTAEAIVIAAPVWATHVSCGGFQDSSFLLYESEEYFQAYFDGDYGGKVEQLEPDSIVVTALPLNTLTQIKEHNNEC